LSETETRPKIMGRQATYEAYIKSDHWAELKAKKFGEAGKVCAFCGSASWIHVHHMNYRHLFDCTTSDLLVLCADCHKLLHRALICLGKLDPITNRQCTESLFRSYMSMDRKQRRAARKDRIAREGKRKPHAVKTDLSFDERDKRLYLRRRMKKLCNRYNIAKRDTPIADIRAFAAKLNEIIAGYDSMVSRGETYEKAQATQKLAIDTDESIVERCSYCGDMVSDWVDPVWAHGRICLKCEAKHEPKPEDTFQETQ
jgi:hypothetical protein